MIFAVYNFAKSEYKHFYTWRACQEYLEGEAPDMKPTNVFLIEIVKEYVKNANTTRY